MDAIEIKVELYPAVEYVPSPGNRPFREAEQAGDKAREESRRRFEEQEDRRFEELMKNQPPEVAAEGRRAREESKALVRKMTERFSQPSRLIRPSIP